MVWQMEGDDGCNSNLPKYCSRNINFSKKQHYSCLVKLLTKIVINNNKNVHQYNLMLLDTRSNHPMIVFKKLDQFKSGKKI